MSAAGGPLWLLGNTCCGGGGALCYHTHMTAGLGGRQRHVGATIAGQPPVGDVHPQFEMI